MVQLTGWWIALVAATLLAQTPQRTRLDQVQAPPEVLAEFHKRLDAYVALHLEAERSLAPRPEQATQEHVRQNQRKLGALIRAARPDAAPGNLLTPGMASHIRRLFEVAFAGPEGQKMLSSIMDENPVGTVVTVNAEYPSDVPLSTMPPDVLAALPKLKEALEFRFVGATMIVIDSHADLVVDLLPDVLPARIGR